ncbi:MAG TPA: nucleotide sugar dehydrogenase [Vicinamibacterales bacterium]|jgi:UDP-N-acetyl-D-glucosamine dehydrogenase|nr:nucleotide sugar dehydrogenase [Vicinamibacterales bacterium]
MSLVANRLRDRLRTRSARTGVVGLGYVGLPLLVELARSGFTAVGIDLDPRKVTSVNRGDSYIPDVPSADLAALREQGRVSATTDFSIVASLDTITICVPTPLRKTKDPDMSCIVSAVEAIAAHMHPGLLVVLESTTYPGTTEELVQPMLEQTGLKAGVDFFLAFSPERVDPGNPTFNTRNVPKVVGGTTDVCSALARELYGAAVDTVVAVSSPRVAEMVKLLENTFRAVNIGLVNEIALMCDRLGLDVWEVVDAARTKPFGFMPFYPGPGLGGHCIPIDPFYLSWKAKQTGFEPRFIELAGQVNSSMPHASVDKVAEALNVHRKPINGSRVLVAGIAYKKNIDDIRESPSLDVMGLLHQKGAHVSYSDLFVPVLKKSAWAGGFELRSVPITADSLGTADCVVILTDHDAVDYEEFAARAQLVVDTRNAIRSRHPHVFKLGAPALSRATRWLGEEDVA